jgi:hypothetical protein
VFQPDSVSQITLFPEAVDRARFVHAMLVEREPANDDERMHWDKTYALIDGRVFSREDLEIAESIQSGLWSGANSSFRLGSIEYPIRLFHDAMDRAIAAHPAR